MEKDNLNHYVAFRITNQQFDKLVEGAAEYGARTISDFLRDWSAVEADYGAVLRFYHDHLEKGYDPLGLSDSELLKLIEQVDKLVTPVIMRVYNMGTVLNDVFELRNLLKTELSERKPVAN